LTSGNANHATVATTDVTSGHVIIVNMAVISKKENLVTNIITRNVILSNVGLVNTTTSMVVPSRRGLLCDTIATIAGSLATVAFIFGSSEESESLIAFGFWM
jgi:hypothetical protein